MDSYYKLQQLFCYKVRHRLLQFEKGIIQSVMINKLRQYHGYRIFPTLVYVGALNLVPGRPHLRI